MAPIIVLGVNAADPPFRIVEIKGEVVGKAFDLRDVLEFARRAGLEDLDLDDPKMVTWVGGDRYTWHA
ncbi:hypothetical protein AQ490_01655 [Wenjunlia vitaminophila]|uniref:Uncharacterized protein n=2 Tax=Wenjunlia vitaminophila TaxID=76728 RepID=A0A0T6M0F7_WENVI|nr:hypothetical protein AQ490_01655 [Wenjunlia vitaminophila]